MTIQIISAIDALTQLHRFNTIIDARSPAEYGEDQLPGAVNWPSLSNDERRVVGTDYKQIGGFEAKKLGAAMVARNVAMHIDREVQDKPKHWLPLVYCWRGGKRSGTLAWFLDQIGFKTTLVEGGYKAFRAAMVVDLARLATQFNYQVICGKTGSGKTRLLQSLARSGAQVLDLEEIALHRGSVLGYIPETPQPSQKHFESQLWYALKRFDPSKPVFVESESKKIGNLRVPEGLIDHMRNHGNCLLLELPDPERVQLLLQDYSFFTKDVRAFNLKLDALIALRGKETVQAWQAKASTGDFAGVFHDLMLHHYDPSYLSSIQRNFKHYSKAKIITAHAVADLSNADFALQVLALAKQPSS